MAEEIKKISFEDFIKEDNRTSDLELSGDKKIESQVEKVNVSVEKSKKEKVGISEGQSLSKEKSGEAQVVSVVQKSPMIKRIEGILEEDLNEVYFKMTDEKKKEFKRVGEETAMSIAEILKNPKYKIKNVLDLIRKWLLLIPGINKFFLEQEAKIKTDKLIESLRNNFN